MKFLSLRSMLAALLCLRLLLSIDGSEKTNNVDNPIKLVRELTETPDSRGRIYEPKVDPNQDMPGGYTEADPNDLHVQKAAKFAVSKSFDDNYIDFTVIDAQTQVVAGINYKLLIDVEFKDGSCRPENFVVYDHFGEYSLTSHNVSPLQCADTPHEKRKHQKWDGHEQRWT
jgi:hypothetical protein